MNFKNVLGLYSELMKAKQTFLLIYTAIFAFLISAWPDQFDLFRFIFLLVSLFLSISGTTLLNMYIDKDMDAIMERTKDRPIPSGRISPNTVLYNGIGLTSLGIILACFTLGWLTGFFVFLGFFFDIVIYSKLLKRKTKYSIIFGGVSGGLPAMIGRIAVLQSVDIVSVYFLIFILAWIPVHILTLALIPKNLEGYKEAGVPMWPVVSSKEQTQRVIAAGAFTSTIVIILISYTLKINPIVLVLIWICNGYLIFLVLKNLLNPTEELTFKIFKFASMFMVLEFLFIYLGVIFSLR